MWPVVTWTQSSMRRLYGTMKKFTRQKKHQVSCSFIELYSEYELVWFDNSLLDNYCIPLEHKHLLKTAQLELKKSKRKDYYKVLGVGKNATEDEIKKAYRKRALMHHPGMPWLVIG